MPEYTAHASAPEAGSRPRLPRRGFLKVGLVGTGVAVLGGAALALRPARLRPLPAHGLKVLTPAQYATVTAVAERVCPAGAGFPDAATVDVAKALDDFLRRADPELSTQVTLALSLFESGLAAALLGEGWTPFSHLDGQARDRRLHAWRDSRIAVRRAIYRALRSACAGLYFADARSWAATGYAGPPSPAVLRSAFRDNLVDLSALQSPGHGR